MVTVTHCQFPCRIMSPLIASRHGSDATIDFDPCVQETLAGMEHRGWRAVIRLAATLETLRGMYAWRVHGGRKSFPRSNVTGV
jgi:hypothetical protein